MKNVAIYLRLSNEDINKRDSESESIKNQRKLLLDEISKHDDWLLYDEYVDEDYSGSSLNRPEFKRMINDCENKNIDIVLVKSQSRFSRDMEVIEHYIHNKFTEWHIQFISIVDGADSFNVYNKKTRQINGLVNEWYLEDTSESIRSSLKIKMKNGECIAPFAPFGYRIKNNKLEIDNIAANIIKRIYSLYISGYGYQGIANKLNNDNIPSPSYYKYLNGEKLNICSNKCIKDIKWSVNAIKTILSNEVYIGNLVQGKRTTISYKNQKIIRKDEKLWIHSLKVHDAIISDYLWNSVQKLRLKNTKECKTNKYSLLSGKVYCGYCSKLLRRKNNGKYIYLFCDNKCSLKRIRYDILKNVIREHILSVIKKNINYSVYSNENDTTINHNDFENKKATIRLYIQELFQDKVKGIIDESTYLELIHNYNEQLTLIDKSILINKHNKLNIDDLFNNESLIINTFVDSIILTDKILINWAI